jgi:hypothetical protein
MLPTIDTTTIKESAISGSFWMDRPGLKPATEPAPGNLVDTRTHFGLGLTNSHFRAQAGAFAIYRCSFRRDPGDDLLRLD